MAGARGLEREPFRKSFWMSIRIRAVDLWSLWENYVFFVNWLLLCLFMFVLVWLVWIILD